ncbi:hypothetical protein [Marinicella rhabdoformis]|uniref:hypothetical protein n=1 Tax=Marinicella rhabdoformis TaxID=2580566 RepID=UPI0012AEB95D|nr:hypothetical protein [Marinicella rhabdoformis]
MRHKGWMSLVLIGGIIWFLLQYPEKVRLKKSQEPSQKVKSNDPQIITENNKVPKEPKIKQPQEKPTEKKLTSEQEYRLEMVMKEIATPEYSEDPYIETTMQMDQLMYCEMFTRGFLRTELEGKIKNTAWDEQYKKHCAAKRNKHPHVLVSSFTGKPMDWIPATSEWGEKVKALRSIPFAERREKATVLVRLALRSQKAHWLQLSLQNTGIDNTFNYGQWLGTRNKSYQHRVTQLAFDHMICHWDADGLCGPTSGIIAESCYQTPNDCGMPFFEWFEKNHMPGVKKDVALVLTKLKAFANGEDVD